MQRVLWTCITYFLRIFVVNTSYEILNLAALKYHQNDKTQTAARFARKIDKIRGNKINIYISFFFFDRVIYMIDVRRRIKKNVGNDLVCVEASIGINKKTRELFHLQMRAWLGHTYNYFFFSFSITMQMNSISTPNVWIFPTFIITK